MLLSASLTVFKSTEFITTFSELTVSLSPLSLNRTVSSTGNSEEKVMAANLMVEVSRVPTWPMLTASRMAVLVASEVGFASTFSELSYIPVSFSVGRGRERRGRKREWEGGRERKEEGEKEKREGRGKETVVRLEYKASNIPTPDL